VLTNAEQALTARDVFEVSPNSQGKWGVKVGLHPDTNYVLTAAMDETVSRLAATGHVIRIISC